MKAGDLKQVKQLSSEILDPDALQDLGKASIQIVHDLKNQLNGLKLYATFLRKRMEVGERPSDEQETIGKLIAGLERAAGDMTTLVRYGRPVELRRKAITDLLPIIKAAGDDGNVRLEYERDELIGEFDVPSLSEAIATITSYSTKSIPPAKGDGIKIRVAKDLDSKEAIIEWQGAASRNGGDPFRSLAGSGGLRMSLARKIVEAHGGHAESDSTLLRVRLPLTKQD